MKPDHEYDKFVDLHVSEWKRKGSWGLPFTWFDVKIQLVLIIVYIGIGWPASIIYWAILDALFPPHWPPPWAR